MKTDYQALCLELFGTDNVEDLRRIAETVPKHNSRGAGRKPKFSKTEIEAMRQMRKQGMVVQQIAEKYHTSRQTVSKYIGETFEGNDTLRIDYMYRNRVCSTIFVDFQNEKVRVLNYTDNLMLRAFGVKENPGWEDFEVFLEDRCFPESRGNCRETLKALGLDSYDPLQIVEKTHGRTAEDSLWMKFTYRGAYEKSTTA